MESAAEQRAAKKAQFMNIREAKLAARVRAINKAHAEGLKVYAQLMEIFTPLLGQNILKADGELFLKIKKLVPEFPNRHDLQVFLSTQSLPYSLAWTVKTCEMIEGTHTCLYHQSTVYIGSMENGVLKDFSHPFTARTDYTVEEIAVAREEVKRIKRLLDEAESKLGIFKMEDN